MLEIIGLIVAILSLIVAIIVGWENIISRSRNEF